MLNALVDRVGMDPALVDDVFMVYFSLDGDIHMPHIFNHAVADLMLLLHRAA